MIVAMMAASRKERERVYLTHFAGAMARRSCPPVQIVKVHEQDDMGLKITFLKVGPQDEKVMSVLNQMIGNLFDVVMVMVIGHNKR